MYTIQISDKINVVRECTVEGYSRNWITKFHNYKCIILGKLTVC